MTRTKPKSNKVALNCDIDPDVRAKLAAVAKLEGITIPELLEKILRPELQRRMVTAAAS